MAEPDDVEGLNTELRTCRNAGELSLRFHGIVVDLGFENGVLGRVAANGDLHVLLAVLPSGFAHRYIAGNFHVIDPVLTHLPRRRSTFLWDELVGDAASPSERMMMAVCRKLGVHSGLTIPIPDRGPSVREFLSLSMRRPTATQQRRLGQLEAVARCVSWRLQAFEHDLKPLAVLSDTRPRIRH